MKAKFYLVLALVISLPIVLINCTGDDDDDDKPGINIFSISDDVSLGKETKLQVESDAVNYPILDSAKNPVAYQHLYRIRDNILASGKVKYKDDFPWYVRIIDNDSTVNAFAIPGGYMYFYTGIINELDNEAQFAGVMAHEMAHIDRRHSTNYLTKLYGVSVLVGLLAGDNPGLLTQIATSLLSLSFSRSNEYDADEHAVKYTYETEYHAPSLGDFFVKMEGLPHPPAFLSTHPSPDDRLEMINTHWTTLGGKDGETFDTRYEEFKKSLP